MLLKGPPGAEWALLAKPALWGSATVLQYHTASG